MKLRDDLILDEIHEIRQAHAARFNYDVAAIFEDIRVREAASGRKIVRLPRRRADPEKTGAERRGRCPVNRRFPRPCTAQKQPSGKPG